MVERNLRLRFPPYAAPALLAFLLGHASPEGFRALDTLMNHAAAEPLVLLRYGDSAARGAGPGKGMLLGHNSHLRQQYAEKYGMPGGGQVVGLLAHMGGRVLSGDRGVEFAVYDVAANGLPGKKVSARKIPYGDLDLMGGPMPVWFSPGAEVGDSFFVAMDLGDYAHGGQQGDTLGLYACRAGCRSEADLALYGRTAVQWHNHDKADWHDFYYQNFTPLPIHLALYPLVEKRPSAIRTSAAVSGWMDIRVLGRSGRSSLEMRFNLPKAAEVRFRLVDASGRILYGAGSWRVPAGRYGMTMAVPHILRGMVLLQLEIDQRRISRLIVVP